MTKKPRCPSCNGPNSEGRETCVYCGAGMKPDETLYVTVGGAATTQANLAADSDYIPKLDSPICQKIAEKLPDAPTVRGFAPELGATCEQCPTTGMWRLSVTGPRSGMSDTGEREMAAAVQKAQQEQADKLLRGVQDHNLLYEIADIIDRVADADLTPEIGADLHRVLGNCPASLRSLANRNFKGASDEYDRRYTRPMR